MLPGQKPDGVPVHIFSEVQNMIFAMSDIHGQYELLARRVEQLRPFLTEGGNQLILLGDYIDRGNRSYECLKLVYDLEQEFGNEKVIVLKGNHEVWFEEFLFRNEDIWLAEDRDFFTSGTFLSKEQFRELEVLPDREARIAFVKACIKRDHKELLAWMRKLRLFYETDTQIFVHAGVDEEIPEEEAAWCTIGTPDYVMTGKYPPSVGPFYKDIIAGHVAASYLARDKGFRGIFFDGQSHYYIDGSAIKSGSILCLAYDGDKRAYYQLEEDGSFREIQARAVNAQV